MAKFRSWVNGKFLYFKNGIYSETEDCKKCINGVFHFNWQNAEQTTELCDKNCKEIFVGDIVRFIWWWFDGAERESELTGTIVYSSDNMSFQLKGVKNKEWRDFVGADEHDMDYLTPFSELNFSDADFEIVGNIHEGDN